MKGLLELTWLEMVIFLREPMGAVSSILAPVGLYVIYGSMRDGDVQSMNNAIPAFAVVGIGLSSIISLVIIMAVYREGGILKRLRATPLRPYTILTAHFLSRLALTSLSITLMLLIGIFLYGVQPSNVNFSLVIVFVLSTVSLVSMGFIVASYVPTARLAQPISAFVFYPMIMLTFLSKFPDRIPEMLITFSEYLPMTIAYNMMDGVWQGESLFNFLPDIGLLILYTTVFVTISSKIFKWE